MSNHTVIEDIARELLSFVKLYDKTYASTQRHPTPMEEAAVIMKMHEVIEKAEKEGLKTEDGVSE